MLHAYVQVEGGGRLSNGTVATVTAVSPAGLTVTAAGRAEPVVLPAEFVTGRRADGRPQLSHAWARTIDGVQGGTWDQVHLLATPALDRYRGYVGQSRSIQPTHTWNTTPQAIDDHGGRLVEPYSTPAEQIAAALARAQPKTFAAVDDPYRYERAVRAEQHTHRQHLDQRPPDLSRDVDVAEQRVAARQRDLDDARSRLAHWDEQAERATGWRGLTRSRRQQRHHAINQVQFHTAAVERESQRLDGARHQRDKLHQAQSAGMAFDENNQWRQVRIAVLEAELQRHWTQAVLSAARDGHPAAYGIGRLQTARQTIAEQVETLAAGGASPAPGQPTGATEDPFMALRDLDRAVHAASEQPSLRLVDPTPRTGASRRPGPERPDQHLRHEQLYQAAPSIGIEL